MKKILTSLLIIGAVAALSALPARAQTNAIPNFLSTVEQWATSVNTNYDWTNVTVEVDSGYKQVTGSGAASYIAGQYDITYRWHAGGEVQFFGVGSSVNAFEARAGYTFVKNHDFKLEANLLGGYERDTAAVIGEAELRAVKMLTINSYAATSCSFPFSSKGKFNSSPTFRVGVGFVF